MFDIAQTLSCCRGAKASILADRETWRINSSGGGYLIHYQVNTFPSRGYPQIQDNTSPGLLWLTKSMSFRESPLVFDWFLLRPPPGGNSHTLLYKNTHSNRQGPGRKEVKAALRVPLRLSQGYLLDKRTNKSTSWSQTSEKKKKKKLLERKRNDRDGAK